MRKIFVSLLGMVIMSLFVSGLVFAEAPGEQELTVEDAVIATDVQALKPAGASETFSADVGRVYAFTRVVGAEEETQVKHQWYYGDKLMADITLNIGVESWRTYSNKRILPEWTGDWKVVVTDAEGNKIKEIPFKITEPSE